METPLFSNPQVSLESLPTIKEVNWTRLEANYLKVQLIGICLTYTIILGVFWLTTGLRPKVPFGFSLAVSGVLLFLMIFNLVVARLGFKIKGYAVRQHDLMFRTGLLFRKSTVIPYNRMQHSEIQQGLIDRQFGLSRLAIFTAGGSQSDLVIPGLTHESAEAIRSFVSGKVSGDEEE